MISLYIWECSGSVVECLIQDRGAGGSSLTGVTVFCPSAQYQISFVTVFFKKFSSEQINPLNAIKYI